MGSIGAYLSVQCPGASLYCGLLIAAAKYGEICGAEEIRKVPISEKILGFFKDNLLFFILGAAAIATAVTVILIVKKKMKN